MKLYLVLKEIKSLRPKISFDVPVYVDENHLLTGFNKRRDGFIIPQKKKASLETYKSNLSALCIKLNTIRKLKKDYLDYELVLSGKEPFVKAKFIYDRVQEIIILTEDTKFTKAQLNSFCEFYHIETNSLLSFINGSELTRRLAKDLEDILRLKINVNNQYLIPLLITKINKF
jgi:hypothetical protein